MDEDITGIIAKPPVQYVLPPRYISKYRNAVIKAYLREKDAHRDFGVPKVRLNPPKDFLKKKSRIQIKRTDIKHKHYHKPGYQNKLPAWEPIKLIKKPENQINNKNIVKKLPIKKPTRDFRKENIIGAKKNQPTKIMKINTKKDGHLIRNKFIPKKKEIIKHPIRREQKKDEIHLMKNKMVPKKNEKKIIYKNEKEKIKSSPETESIYSSEILEESTETSSEDIQKTLNSEKEKKLTNYSTEKFEESSETSTEDIQNTEKKKKGSITSIEKLEESSETSTEDIQKTEKKKKGSITSIEKPMELSKKSSKELKKTSQEKKKKEPKCQYMTDKDRAELLYGMKKKWDELMEEFQSLPLLTDNGPKIRRKSKLEKSLIQLEKDIDTIERHAHIYVSEDKP